MNIVHGGDNHHFKNQSEISITRTMRLIVMVFDAVILEQTTIEYQNNRKDGAPDKQEKNFQNEYYNKMNK